VELRTPPDIASLCCGTPWKSKGHREGHEAMRDKVLPSLWEATEQGRLPVVVDASSCTEGLAELVATAAGDARLEVVDSVAFTSVHVLPRLHVRRRVPSLTVHPTCSSTRLGINDDLVAIGQAVAEKVHVPVDWGCCAFAGDRGLLHPELTRSATAAEAATVARRPTAAYASLNRTCEIGMSRATGQEYRHVLEVLLSAAAPGRDGAGDEAMLRPPEE
jgi:D-lactate dehydrogenase